MAKLLHNRHSFRLQPHHRTSYSALAFFLLVIGVFLLFLSQAANGQTVSPAGQINQGIGIAATVPGPPPAAAATILVPANGSHTAVSLITVSGTCIKGLIISIYSNDILVGSTVCDATGSYSLQVSLFDGINSLIARDTDALGQNGPNSPSVTITYDAPSLALPGSSAVGHQLFLESATPTRGSNPGQNMTWQVTIVGGTPPYALNWNWGDGTSTLASAQIEGPVTATHTYTRAGTYRVTIQASDAAGNSAFIQLVAVVNGVVTGTGTTTKIDPTILVSIWPVYILACLFVLVFYIGERRELGKLRKQHLLVSSF